jgi:hypothetical protein
MSYKLPYPQPQTYDPSGQFRNPATTLPMPAGANMPVACWFSGKVNLSWSGVAPNLEAVWRSPIYDLRPNLRQFHSNGSQGNNINTQRAVPVWVGGGGGGGGKLYVQISNLLDNANALDNLELTSQEFAHISDPGALVTVTPEEDITTSLNSSVDSVVLTFTPIGEGTPVRYWSIILRFTKLSGAVTFPFKVEAAYY